MNEVVKHYWKVGYEWNACLLDSYGDVVDVDHGDTLIELFRSNNGGKVMEDIYNDKVLIRLQRWKYSVDQHGEENGDQDFDYAWIDEGWHLDEESD